MCLRQKSEGAGRGAQPQSRLSGALSLNPRTQQRLSILQHQTPSSEASTLHPPLPQSKYGLHKSCYIFVRNSISMESLNLEIFCAVSIVGKNRSSFNINE